MLPLLLLLAQLFSVSVTPNGFLNHRPTIDVKVNLSPDEGNRNLAVEVMSEDYYSLSEKQVDGDKAPTVFHFVFRELPEGDYEIRAILVKWEDGKWKLIHQPAKQQVHVR